MAPFPSITADCSSTLPQKAYAISPDGQWIAYSDCYLPDPTLVVMKRDGTKDWKPHFLDFSNYHEDGFISVDHWSDNGRTLYFYTPTYFDGGLCTSGTEKIGFGLFQLHLEGGNTSPVLSLRTDLKPYMWSLSPSGSWLVFAQEDSLLILKSLTSGQQTSIQIPKQVDLMCGFLWSGNELFLAFSVFVNEGNGLGHWELCLHDIPVNSTRSIMTFPADTIPSITSWSEDGILTVDQRKSSTGETSQIQFDVVSNQIMDAFTLTP